MVMEALCAQQAVVYFVAVQVVYIDLNKRVGVDLCSMRSVSVAGIFAVSRHTLSWPRHPLLAMLYLPTGSL